MSGKSCWWHVANSNFMAVGDDGQRVEWGAHHQEELDLFTGMQQGELCSIRWRDVNGVVDGGMDADGLIHIGNTLEIVKGGTELTARPKNGVQCDVPWVQDSMQSLAFIHL